MTRDEPEEDIMIWIDWSALSILPEGMEFLWCLELRAKHLQNGLRRNTLKYYELLKLVSVLQAMAAKILMGPIRSIGSLCVELMSNWKNSLWKQPLCHRMADR